METSMAEAVYLPRLPSDGGGGGGRGAGGTGESSSWAAAPFGGGGDRSHDQTSTAGAGASSATTTTSSSSPVGVLMMTSGVSATSASKSVVGISTNCPKTGVSTRGISSQDGAARTTGTNSTGDSRTSSTTTTRTTIRIPARDPTQAAARTSCSVPPYLLSPGGGTGTLPPKKRLLLYAKLSSSSSSQGSRDDDHHDRDGGGGRRRPSGGGGIPAGSAGAQYPATPTGGGRGGCGVAPSTCSTSSGRQPTASLALSVVPCPGDGAYTAAPPPTPAASAACTPRPSGPDPIETGGVNHDGGGVATSAAAAAAASLLGLTARCQQQQQQGRKRPRSEGGAGSGSGSGFSSSSCSEVGTAMTSASAAAAAEAASTLATALAFPVAPHLDSSSSAGGGFPPGDTSGVPARSNNSGGCPGGASAVVLAALRDSGVLVHPLQGMSLLPAAPASSSSGGVSGPEGAAVVTVAGFQHHPEGHQQVQVLMQPQLELEREGPAGEGTSCPSVVVAAPPQSSVPVPTESLTTITTKTAGVSGAFASPREALEYVQSNGFRDKKYTSVVPVVHIAVGADGGCAGTASVESVGGAGLGASSVGVAGGGGCCGGGRVQCQSTTTRGRTCAYVSAAELTYVGGVGPDGGGGPGGDEEMRFYCYLHTAQQLRKAINCCNGGGSKKPLRLDRVRFLDWAGPPPGSGVPSGTGSPNEDGMAGRMTADARQAAGLRGHSGGGGYISQPTAATGAGVVVSSCPSTPLQQAQALPQTGAAAVSLLQQQQPQNQPVVTVTSSCGGQRQYQHVHQDEQQDPSKAPLTPPPLKKRKVQAAQAHEYPPPPDLRMPMSVSMTTTNDPSSVAPERRDPDGCGAAPSSSSAAAAAAVAGIAMLAGVGAPIAPVLGTSPPAEKSTTQHQQHQQAQPWGRLHHVQHPPPSSAVAEQLPPSTSSALMGVATVAAAAAAAAQATSSASDPHHPPPASGGSFDETSLNSVPISSWRGRLVTVTTGPFSGRCGRVVRWGNGWVTVKLVRTGNGVAGDSSSPQSHAGSLLLETTGGGATKAQGVTPNPSAPVSVDQRSSFEESEGAGGGSEEGEGVGGGGEGEEGEDGSMYHNRRAADLRLVMPGEEGDEGGSGATEMEVVAEGRGGELLNRGSPVVSAPDVGAVGAADGGAVSVVGSASGPAVVPGIASTPSSEPLLVTETDGSSTPPPRVCPRDDATEPEQRTVGGQIQLKQFPPLTLQEQEQGVVAVQDRSSHGASNAAADPGAATGGITGSTPMATPTAATPSSSSSLNCSPPPSVDVSVATALAQLQRSKDRPEVSTEPPAPQENGEGKKKTKKDADVLSDDVEPSGDPQEVARSVDDGGEGGPAVGGPVAVVDDAKAAAVGGTETEEAAASPVTSAGAVSKGAGGADSSSSATFVREVSHSSAEDANPTVTAVTTAPPTDSSPDGAQPAAAVVAGSNSAISDEEGSPSTAQPPPPPTPSRPSGKKSKSKSKKSKSGGSKRSSSSTSSSSSSGKKKARSPSSAAMDAAANAAEFTLEDYKKWMGTAALDRPRRCIRKVERYDDGVFEEKKRRWREMRRRELHGDAHADTDVDGGRGTGGGSDGGGTSQEEGEESDTSDRMVDCEGDSAAAGNAATAVAQTMPLSPVAKKESERRRGGHQKPPHEDRNHNSRARASSASAGKGAASQSKASSQRPAGVSQSKSANGPALKKNHGTAAAAAGCSSHSIRRQRSLTFARGSRVLITSGNVAHSGLRGIIAESSSGWYHIRLEGSGDICRKRYYELEVLAPPEEGWECGDENGGGGRDSRDGKMRRRAPSSASQDDVDGGVASATRANEVLDIDTSPSKEKQQIEGNTHDSETQVVAGGHNEEEKGDGADDILTTPSVEQPEESNGRNNNEHPDEKIGRKHLVQRSSQAPTSSVSDCTGTSVDGSIATKEEAPSTLGNDACSRGVASSEKSAANGRGHDPEVQKALVNPEVHGLSADVTDRGETRTAEHGTTPVSVTYKDTPSQVVQNLHAVDSSGAEKYKVALTPSKAGNNASSEKSSSPTPLQDAGIQKGKREALDALVATGGQASRQVAGGTVAALPPRIGQVLLVTDGESASEA